MVTRACDSSSIWFSGVASTMVGSASGSDPGVRPQGGSGQGVSWKVPETWCPGGFLGVPNTAPGSVLVFDQPLVSYGSVCGQNGGRSGPSSLKLVSSR